MFTLYWAEPAQVLPTPQCTPLVPRRADDRPSGIKAKKLTARHHYGPLRALCRRCGAVPLWTAGFGPSFWRAMIVSLGRAVSSPGAARRRDVLHRRDEDPGPHSPDQVKCWRRSAEMSAFAGGAPVRDAFGDLRILANSLPRDVGGGARLFVSDTVRHAVLRAQFHRGNCGGP